MAAKNAPLRYSIGVAEPPAGKLARPAVVLAVLVAVCASGGVGRARAERQPSPPRTDGGTWTRRKPLPVGAVFAGTALGADRRIYVISGSTQYDVRLTDAVHVYDPRSDSWTEAAPIPTPRTEPGAATGPDGRIYVVGGGDPGRKKNVLEAYDPKSNSWTRLAPMPTPRESLCAVAAKGRDGRTRIYAIGGRDRSRPGNGLSVVEAYDPSTNTWTSMSPMPTYLHGQAATFGPDGRIYVLGGTNDQVSATNAVEVYDPARDAWTQGTPMPYGQECAAVTSTSGRNGEILVFGGWDARKRSLRAALAFNPRTRRWRSLPDLPSPRAAGAAVALQGTDGCIHAYVLGGTAQGADGDGGRVASAETVVEEYAFRPGHGPR